MSPFFVASGIGGRVVSVQILQEFVAGGLLGQLFFTSSTSDDVQLELVLVVRQLPLLDLVQPAGDVQNCPARISSGSSVPQIGGGTNETMHTAKTKYRYFETNIPRKVRSGSQSQFPHSYVCERFIYSLDRSAYSAGGNM
jgi:hypothetical protein